MQNSSVGVVTELFAGFYSRKGQEVFIFSTAPRPALGTTQPPNQYKKYFEWVKRPKREADHSPNSSADVKNLSSYTSTPPYAFMA
jgi:hypothetical protein